MSRPRKQRSPSLPARKLPEFGTPEYWWAVLPKPPIGEERDGVIAAWLEDVLRDGGPKALDWLQEPANWPLSTMARGRMMYYVNLLLERANNQAKRDAEMAARDQQAKAAEAREARRREAGWA